MLPATQIIKKPLITEKCTWEGQSRNRYSFLVDMHADKREIKAAVAEIYKVRVLSVSTQIRKGHAHRTRHGMSKTADWKRATVQLHPDDRIDLF